MYILMHADASIFTEEKQTGKESLAKAKTKPISTTGTKSHACVREELVKFWFFYLCTYLFFHFYHILTSYILKKQRLNGSPTRTELYLECHQHENEAEITVRVYDLTCDL